MCAKPQSTRRRDWPAVLALLMLAFVVRGGVLVALPDGLNKDPDGYRRIAENVLRSGVYSFDTQRDEFAIEGDINPTAYRPPLYPLLLTKFDVEQRIPAYRVGLLHLALGLGTVWLTWKLGMLWKLGHWSLVAGALVACDPILLNQSAQVMTETPATFLAILALYSLTRLSQTPTPWNAALAGGAIALGVLCRPTFLPWLAAVAVVTPFLVFSASRATKGKPLPKPDPSRSWLRLANLAALIATASVVLSPWVVRNYQVYGKPILTTTHGGYTLRLGNNEYFFDYLRNGRPGTVWSASDIDDDLLFILPKYRRVNRFLTPAEIELEKDEILYRMAREAIAAEPLTFLYACLYRVGQLWSPLPHEVEGDSPSRLRQLARYPIATWYVAVFVLAVGGAWSLGRKLWRTPWLWGVLLCLVFTAVHTLYWSNLRMRAPLMPVVCLLAAIGVGQVVHYLRGQRRTGRR